MMRRQLQKSVINSFTKSRMLKFILSLGIIFGFLACGAKGEILLKLPTSGSAGITLSPTRGSVGTLLTITSEDINLSAPLSVSVSGTSVMVLSSASTKIQALLLSPVSGAVVVTLSTGATVSATSAFTYEAQTPIANQQGSKLVGSDSTNSAKQGYAVSLSADGNTALVGGFNDTSPQGAVWVYTRRGGVWSQQGSKLVGNDATGNARQGHAVSLSADGNTALFSGPSDNTNQGASWVFTRSGGVWSQQGSKLVGTGNVGAAVQGSAVSISADGNTALIGSEYDNAFTGAVWIFTRSGGVWSQQGSKLVGTGSTGTASQGYAVSLSADGNTALVGGYTDNTNRGAAWVFTRSGGVWSQQGSKLVGTGNVGNGNQGYSVSLSADGNTALIGARYDDGAQGAAWVFTRSGGVWSQQGSKLVGTGNTGAAYQGSSVSLSADGNTALIGAIADNSFQGAAWVFTRSGGVWSQQGSKLVGSGSVGASNQGISMSLSADGKTAIIGGHEDNSLQGAAWIFVQ